MASPNSLPSVTRLITTHNAAGEAIFDKTIPPTAAWELRPPAPNLPQAAFFLAYTTSGFPVNLNPATEGGREQDIERYEKNLNDPPKALSHENGAYTLNTRGSSSAQSQSELPNMLMLT